MSFTQTRTDVALALGAITGVKGFITRPSTVKAGDAWTLLSSVERDTGGFFTVNWRVVVMLPQGDLASTEWIDDHFEAILDALQPIGYVERLEPGSIPMGPNSEALVLAITMRSE